MRPADGKIMFGEWLPDAQELDNPGLTEAKNVIDIDGFYRPFRPLTTTGMDALDSAVLGGIVTGIYTYVGLATSLYRSTTSLGTWTDYTGGAISTTTSWSFARFDNSVIAAPGTATPQIQTIGSGTDFANLATSGTCPVSAIVGKIGRFIMVGNTATATYHVQWSAIDDIRDWPTPGTADATSKQAGQQYLRAEWGAVTGIVGSDRSGLIFQQNGITRVMYVGGNVVWHFDEISNIGCPYPHCIVQHGNGWFFLSRRGLCFTDGTTVVPVGAGKTDKYFQTTHLGTVVPWAAIDPFKKLIYIAYSTSASSFCDRILVYNAETQRFTRADQNIEALLSQPEVSPSTNVTMRAFNTSHAGRLFSGSYGTATLTSAEVELHPGGRTLVQGVKPLVSTIAGVNPTITVALGTRDDQDTDSTTYTAESTPHSRTGFAGFRQDARFHRARLTIAGEFDAAMGAEIQAVPAGAA